MSSWLNKCSKEESNLKKEKEKFLFKSLEHLHLKRQKNYDQFKAIV